MGTALSTPFGVRWKTATSRSMSSPDVRRTLQAETAGRRDRLMPVLSRSTTRLASVRCRRKLSRGTEWIPVAPGAGQPQFAGARHVVGQRTVRSQSSWRRTPGSLGCRSRFEGAVCESKPGSDGSWDWSGAPRWRWSQGRRAGSRRTVTSSTRVHGSCRNAVDAVGQTPAGGVQVAWRVVSSGVELLEDDGRDHRVRRSLFVPLSTTKQGRPGIGLALSRLVAKRMVVCAPARSTTKITPELGARLCGIKELYALEVEGEVRFSPSTVSGPASAPQASLLTAHPASCLLLPSPARLTAIV